MRDTSKYYSDTPTSGVAPENLFIRARREMLDKFPFFGILALRLNPVFTDKIPTTAVDLHGNILLNPKWLNGMTEGDLVFEIAHEVMHIVQGCFARCRPEYNKAVWNLAADQIIDTALVDAELNPSRVCQEMTTQEVMVLARQDKTTEVRYHNLLKEQEKNGAGAGAGNIRQCSVASEFKNLTAGEDKALADFVKEWSEHIISAKLGTAGKEKGNSSSFGDEIINAILKPKIRWQQYLRTLATTTFLRQRYTYKRISRRGLACSTSLPSLRPEPKSATFMLDSSGSMASDLIARGLGEAIGILKACNCESMQMICHTHDVYAHTEIKAVDLKTFKVLRGGTSHVEAFEVASGKSKKWPAVKSDLVVAFTDLETSFPSKKPDFPVIWLHPSESRSHTVPWGMKLELKF